MEFWSYYEMQEGESLLDAIMRQADDGANTARYLLRNSGQSKEEIEKSAKIARQAILDLGDTHLATANSMLAAAIAVLHRHSDAGPNERSGASNRAMELAKQSVMDIVKLLDPAADIAVLEASLTELIGKAPRRVVSADADGQDHRYRNPQVSFADLTVGDTYEVDQVIPADLADDSQSPDFATAGEADGLADIAGGLHTANTMTGRGWEESLPVEWLRGNELFRLWETHAETMCGEGGVLDEPCATYEEFVHWLLARSLLYGLSRVRVRQKGKRYTTLETTLRQLFPAWKGDLLKIRNLAWEESWLVESSHGVKASANRRPGLLRVKSPGVLLSQLYAAEPKAHSLLFLLAQLYSDLGRGEGVAAVNLPAGVQPDTQKQGPRRYRQRIRNVASLRGQRAAVKSFNVSASKVREYAGEIVDEY